jgi:hypothetical protein
VRITVARWSGRCWECQCRYRAGEVLILLDDAAYHMDCFRTRGSLELQPYEDNQPRELDRLLAVIQAEELLAGHPA